MQEQNTSVSGTVFKDSFSEEIWRSTYKDHSDKDVSDTFRRVAKHIASAETTPEKKAEWESKFYDLLSGFKGLAGGRITANAGTDWNNTTLMNCYVGSLPSENLDSIDGIYKVLVDQANTLKSEGGWGMDFSWIRPRGSFIKGIGVESPGAIRFMELFDKSSEIVTAGSGKKSTNTKSKGKIRKGAMMATLNCFDFSAKIRTNKGEIEVGKICEERDPSLLAMTETGSFPIVDWIVNPEQQLFLVEDEFGNTVQTTSDHKFQVYNIETEEEYLRELSLIDPAIEMLVRFEE